MSDPVTHGAITKGVARLSEHGTTELDEYGKILSVSADIYEVWLGYGVRATSANVSGLPAVNSVHPDYGVVIVSGYRFNLVGIGNGIWHISVDYARGEVTKTSGGEDNPQRVTSRSWDIVENTADLVTDAITGEAVLNSAGDPFDSVPQVPRADMRVSISFLTGKSPEDYMSVNGTVNSSVETILGHTFPAYTGKIRATVRDTMIETGLRYEVTIEVEQRTNLVKDFLDLEAQNIGWREAFVQCGYSFVELGTDGERYKFTEKIKNSAGVEEEREVSSPQLLGILGEDNRGLPARIKIVNVFKSSSWSDLDIPS